MAHRLTLSAMLVMASFMFSAPTQAQSLCSGAGIHETCLNSSGSYNQTYSAAQTKMKNDRSRAYGHIQTTQQKAHAAAYNTHNKAALFSTELNNGQLPGKK